jgi:hypothetical protein
VGWKNLLEKLHPKGGWGGAVTVPVGVFLVLLQGSETSTGHFQEGCVIKMNMGKESNRSWGGSETASSFPRTVVSHGISLLVCFSPLAVVRLIFPATYVLCL